MQVDPISNFEKEKESFYNLETDKWELGFGKWLCLELYIQIALNNLNEEDEPDYECNEVNSKVLNFMKEEKLWRISSVIDDFGMDSFNNTVYKLLSEQASKY